MRPIAIALLTATMIAAAALSVAGAATSGAGSKPSSYVPQTGTHSHIYGTPIQPPILGHVKPSHHKHTRMKSSTGAAARRSAHLLPPSR
jgi:hypothetical protein